MKLAISSSLQGYPEESSPGDPMDTRRLGEYVAVNLSKMFPQIEVDLLNRDDFPGMGDAYTAVRDAVVRWGADIHVSIHQDASSDPNARGWMVLYYHAEALYLANEISAAMKGIPSPFRGVIYRDNVAVLKKPTRTVLVEAGFYTRPEDENLGVSGWGGPIVQGIANYLARHYGIYPQQGEGGEGMSAYPLMEVEKQGDKFVWVASDCFTKSGMFNNILCYLNIYNENAFDVEVEVFTSPNGKNAKYPIPKWGRLSVDMKGLAPDSVGFATIVKCSRRIPPVMTILCK